MKVTDLPDHLREALSARYELGAELGRGGMAVVFRARDLRHDRDVAIKVLKPGVLSTRGAERFLQEIQIQARLQHPNILPLHESGAVDGALYYVMPCVTGESLRERIDRQGPLSVDEALQITREVADALLHAHSQEIIHRDIKPSNILLSSGHAVVSDFGIARALSKAASDRLTDTGIAIGTPEYMSPEQASGDEEVDARTDIYALGCVLFEMLAGEPPYTGRSAQAVIARHMQERLPSLEVVRPEVPAQVIRTVQTCLAKAPADRFGSTQELLEALEAPAPEAAIDRRSRVKTAVLVGVALALAATLTWLGVRSPSVTLDSRKVVVFPLEERGRPVAEAGAGYDVALMIELALDHTEPLRWIDGRKRLETRLRQDISLLTPELARDISREQGARYYIDGVVRHGRDSTVLVIGLNDVAGDSVIAREGASAHTGQLSPAQLGLQAVRKLLPSLLAPGREVDLTPVSDRSPAAIALWLQGEREYRQVRFKGALEFYERALGEDSALVIAAIKGAQAANWFHDSRRAQALVTAALSRDSLLPERYRHFARGLEGYLSGQGRTAEAQFKEALARAPDWSEAFMALGEVYYHLIPKWAPLDSLAMSAFEQSVLSDTAFTPALFHLAEMALRRGAIVRAGQLISRFESANPEVWLTRHLELLYRCVREGKVDWKKEASLDALIALRAAVSLSVAAGHAACAERGFRAVLSADNSEPSERWGALLGLQGLLATQGRERELVALIDSTFAAGTQVAVLLYLIDASAGARVGQEAERADSILAALTGEDYRGLSPGFLWLVGTWHAERGSRGRAEAIRDELSRRSREDAAGRPTVFHAVLATHLLYLNGDTAAAISRLRDIVPDAPRETLDWGLAEPLPTVPILLARLLLARAQHDEAHAVASAYDHGNAIVYLPFVATSLAIRYRAAQAMGRRDLMRTYRERLVGLGRSDLFEGEP